MVWPVVGEYGVVLAVAVLPVVGELLTAVPLGLALRLDPAGVFLMAVGGNALPAVALHLLVRLGERHPRLGAFFAQRPVPPLLRRLGVWGAVVGLPLLGVYVALPALYALGMERASALRAVLAGLLVWGAVLTLLSLPVLGAL